MPKDLIGYEQIIQSQLRGVVREVLKRVSKRGFPADHHCYITFATHAPGVMIADWLKAQYPDEMTIVLQHRFWGLDVLEDRFEVTLSFRKVPERLIVPYAAVRVYHDPFAEFGLQFREATGSAGITGALGAPAVAPALPPGPGARDAGGDNPRENARDAPPEAGEGSGGDAPTTAPAGGTVVSLDKFRKK